MAGNLTAQDVSILNMLKAEMRSLRQSIRLAEMIATYPDSQKSAHPVVNFAFARTGPAAIENLLLRMAEAVDPIWSARSSGSSGAVSLSVRAGSIAQQVTTWISCSDSAQKSSPTV